VSATTNRLLPPGAVPIPEGLRNSDACPVPSANPGVPAKPARVVTTPLCVTFRTVWFPVSHRNSEVPSLVIPEGDRKRASGPVPSAEPGVPDVPARVVTSPNAAVTTTWRMVWFPVSAT